MDDQHWPDWPADDPHLDGADTAGLGDHDLAGHDLAGHDPFGHDAAFPPEPGLEHDPGPGDLGPADLDTADLDTADLDTAGLDTTHVDTADLNYGDDLADHPAHSDDDPFGPDHATFDLSVDGALDHPVGADPELPPHADGDWADPSFPPALHLPDAPEPVDGYPWAAPQTLGAGDPPQAPPVETAWPTPPAADLLDYAADTPPAGTDAWQALLDSDDPATSNLARWWAPGE